MTMAGDNEIPPRRSRTFAGVRQTPLAKPPRLGRSELWREMVYGSLP